MKYFQKTRLLSRISQVDADIILLDIGAGISFNIVDFFLLAEQGILVVIPEPSSIENAYRFLKMSFYRHLWRSLKASPARKVVEEAMDQKNHVGIRSPFDLLEAVERIDAASGRFLKENGARVPPPAPREPGALPGRRAARPLDVRGLPQASRHRHRIHRRGRLRRKRLEGEPQEAAVHARLPRLRGRAFSGAGRARHPLRDGELRRRRRRGRVDVPPALRAGFLPGPRGQSTTRARRRFNPLTRTRGKSTATRRWSRSRS